MMTDGLCLECGEEPEVTWSEVWSVQWLRDGWNLAVQQQVLHCKGGVTRHIVVWDPFVSLFSQPFPRSVILYVLQTFNVKIRIYRVAYTDMWLFHYTRIVSKSEQHVCLL
jgi:hypothetical protein